MQRGTDVVQTLQQPVGGVVVDLEAEPLLPRCDGAAGQVDGQFDAGAGLEELPEFLHHVLVDGGDQQPRLAGVAAEDVTEPGPDDDLEAVVLQRPDRVLSRRPGAEVRSGHEHRTRGVCGLVQHELGVTPPSCEQAVLETSAGDPLEVDRRDDLVGIDVAATQRYRDAGVAGVFLHDQLPLTGPTVLTGDR